MEISDGFCGQDIYLSSPQIRQHMKVGRVIAYTDWIKVSEGQCLQDDIKEPLEGK